MSYNIPQPIPESFENPSKEKQIVNDAVTQILEKIEYKAMQGVFIHVKGGLHPKKGFPTPEAIWAINQVKILIREAIKFPLLFVHNKNKLLNSFNFIVNKGMSPYYLKEFYLCPTASAINWIGLIFLVRIGVNQTVASNTAKIFAHVFEYDDAYRYRIQDLANATSSEAMAENPRREIKKLMNILRERELYNQVVQPKFEIASKLLLIALLIPKYKKAFIEAIQGQIERMQPDKGDWYWMCMRGDYDFGGLSYAERHKLFTQYPEQIKLSV